MMSAVSLLAKDAFEVIEKDGALRFSDGSSIYSFQKDGGFELGPVSMSGRKIVGKWRREEAFFIIEGEWTWSNGVFQPGDIRIMRLYFSPTEEKEEVGYRKEAVTKGYFTIESLQKK
jgi:hypothetical protein